MMQAIKIARKSKEKIPVGVIIVKDGVVLAKSYNSQHEDNLITSHAEIKALEKSEKRLNQKNIIGCTVYTTCEPCTMCAGALFYAKVDKIVYGATMADIDPDNERIKLTIEYLASQKQNPPQIMQIMRDQCIAELYS